MKAVEIYGPEQVRIVQQPMPKAHGDFVVVKVHVIPTCTEYKSFQEGKGTNSLGHEAAGEVVEVAQPGRLKVGDRVVVMPFDPCGKCELCLSGESIHCLNYHDSLAETGNTTGLSTYAQYLIKEDWYLVPIPDDISYEHASMAVCGLGPTYGAMEKMNVGSSDTVMITGMGPVGLGGVINGKYRGAQVIAVESHPYRADLAKRLGADLVLNPTDEGNMERVMDFTDGRGVDKGIDCSGAAPAHRFLLDAARRKGHVAIVGLGRDALEVDVGAHMIQKGLTIHGSWHYNHGDTHKMMRIIRDVRPQLDMLITHRFPMSQVEEAWRLQMKGATGKVLLDPWA